MSFSVDLSKIFSDYKDMTTKDYGSTILMNLEKRGYTKDLMISHLTGVLNGLKYIDNKHLHEFMDREIDYSNPIDMNAFSMRCSSNDKSPA